MWKKRGSLPVGSVTGGQATEAEKQTERTPSSLRAPRPPHTAFQISPWGPGRLHSPEVRPGVS